MRDQIAGSSLGCRRNRKALAPPANERLDVTENRVKELAQTKVEASQRFPIKLTGSLLFNAYANGANSGEQQYPTVAQTTAGPSGSGASFRQTVLGLQFDGPTWAGAKLGGTAYMDFFGGTSSSLNHLLRLRIATMATWPGKTPRSRLDRINRSFLAAGAEFAGPGGSFLAFDGSRQFVALAATGAPLNSASRLASRQG